MFLLLTDGVDFSGGEYRIEIPSGTREHCTNISVIDDSLAFEGDEVFVVKFDISQLPDGVEPGPTNISVVRIIDDDGKSVCYLYSYLSICFSLFQSSGYSLIEIDIKGRKTMGQ